MAPRRAPSARPALLLLLVACCCLLLPAHAVPGASPPSEPPAAPAKPAPVVPPPNLDALKKRPTAEVIANLKSKLAELNPDGDPSIGTTPGAADTPPKPDLSKLDASLRDAAKKMKDGVKLPTIEKPKLPKLPKLQSKSKLPLECAPPPPVVQACKSLTRGGGRYDLASFTEVYAGDRHGIEPTDHPKHDRSVRTARPFPPTNLPANLPTRLLLADAALCPRPPCVPPATPPAS